jgi:hypothetical protein
VVKLLDAFGDAADLLCYASGYPHWNTDAVDDIAQRLPPSWHAKVFHDNARDWFRWPDRERRRAAGPTVEVGAMPATGLTDAPQARREYPTEDGMEVEWMPAAD